MYLYVSVSSKRIVYIFVAVLIISVLAVILSTNMICRDKKRKSKGKERVKSIGRVILSSFKILLKFNVY